MAEVAVLLHEVGRRAAELPVWETLACGLLPLVRSGSEGLQADLIPRIVAGDLLLSPALRGSATDRQQEGLTGTKVGVPVLDGPTLLLVSVGGRRGDRRPRRFGREPRAGPAARAERPRRPIPSSPHPCSGTLDADVVQSVHAIAGLAAWGAGVVRGPVT